MYTLKFWEIKSFWTTGEEMAFGLVYDNPKFEDGTDIHTSTIVSKETREDGYVITTKSGSTYFLPFSF